MGEHIGANREFKETLEVIDNNVARLSTADYKLTFFSRLISFYQNYVHALVGRQAFTQALEVADSSRARILFERLSIEGKPARRSGGDYRAIAKSSGSVILFYWLAPKASYLWVVTPERIHPPVELPPADQIQRWVDEYRAFVEQRAGDPMAAENQAGRRLYETLIVPATLLAPTGSRMIVVPDGALHWLNFETLPVYGAPGEKPHYWIEDVRSVVAPSLAVLATEEQAKPRAPDSLLIIGDPVASPEFPALAHAPEEIASIRQHFPAASQETFTGPKARPGVYLEAQPGRFALLHFSAHGVANQQSPLDSAIILSKEGLSKEGLSREGENFKLYARNILTVRLAAELVTISACRSAGARSYSGEGLVGFAWAFLQAGARNVIAGLWDVTDSATRGIMNVLYARIVAGDRPADALRQAKLNLIHSAGRFRKPYYWGPFQLYIR